jgi:hypothetical protein
LRPFTKLLTDRRLKGDRLPALPPDETWYVLVLVEQTQFARRVEYRRVRGLVPAAQELAKFVKGAGPGVFRGLHDARFFATEAGSGAYFNEHVQAGRAAGATEVP